MMQYLCIVRNPLTDVVEELQARLDSYQRMNRTRDYEEKCKAEMELKIERQKIEKSARFEELEREIDRLQEKGENGVYLSKWKYMI